MLPPIWIEKEVGAIFCWRPLHGIYPLCLRLSLCSLLSDPSLIPRWSRRLVSFPPDSCYSRDCQTWLINISRNVSSSGQSFSRLQIPALSNRSSDLAMPQQTLTSLAAVPRWKREIGAGFDEKASWSVSLSRPRRADKVHEIVDMQLPGPHDRPPVRAVLVTYRRLQGEDTFWKAIFGGIENIQVSIACGALSAQLIWAAPVSLAPTFKCTLSHLFVSDVSVPRRIQLNALVIRRYVYAIPQPVSVPEPRVIFDSRKFKA